MKTVPGRKFRRKSKPGWTDTHSAFAISIFIALVYIVFFNPVLRYDGLLYMSPARSLLFDGNLNTYNESCYYSIPGWSDVAEREITGNRRILVSYVYAPEYTHRGYRYVVFPIGNPVTWLPPLAFTQAIHRWAPMQLPHFAEDGFSFPYRMTLGWWSFIIGITGIILAYRILRRWYDPFVSCFSVLFVTGAGNLIPFITHDVTFSHGVDFLLINAVILMFFEIRDQYLNINQKPTIHEHFLWGLLIAYATIVRYQVVVLLVFPVVLYIYMFLKKSAFKWQQPLTFIAGFAFTTGLQFTYWKILYGRFLISTDLMGTGKLESFSPLEPQIIPMLFSRFHGFYNWLPWMLPLTIAALFIIRKDKLFGLLFVFVMASQFYYIATRSEWWNLGFSVRRFSSWSLFFMLGAAEISSYARNIKSRIILLIFAVPILIWTWLFKIHYLMRTSANSIFPQILHNAIPYYHDNFKPVVPRLAYIIDGISALSVWFTQHIWTSSLQHFFKTNQYALFLGLLTAHVFFLTICILFVVYFTARQSLSKKTLLIALTSYFGVFYICMTASDYLSENILAHKIVRGKPVSMVQEIRLRKGRYFEGENSVAELSNEPLVFDHPEQVNNPVAWWLIGVKKNSENISAELEISIRKHDTVYSRKTIPLDPSGSGDVVSLERPWGDASYHHEWFRIKTDFSDIVAVPEQWEISASEEVGAVVGALWHIPD